MRNEARMEGRQEGEIIGAVRLFKQMGSNDQEIIDYITSDYHLSKEQAEEAINSVLS